MSKGSYFVRVDDRRYLPTDLTGGAWTEAEQHISPLNGLIVHAVDRFVAARGTDDLVISRISIDILGVLAIEEFDVEVDVVRPGRTIELLEVTVTAAGRPAVRARVWRMSGADTSSVAGGPADRLAPPDGLSTWPMSELWPGGYIASLDVRPVTPPQPGRTTAWLSTQTALVAGEETGPLARYVALVDTANGIAVRRKPTEWMFPNLDLTIHLARQPSGDWVGLDTTVTFGPDGHGLTTSVLHDLDGPIGQANQILTVRPLG
ncbi:thioesterase family protein [Rhodococcus sp. NPDC003318]|uniref:thioesterase family protein n=1 Tax=Rhodococcus sp. NPDC003318 TaxID=3364503 RepID=UPI0036C9C263